MKKLTIIARYNEDIEWSKELDGDILIYNKGENWPWEDIPRVDIENYGRECETYARAIVECYEMLDDYDCVIFIQGNPFDHDDDPVESINEYNSNEIVFLANSMVTYKLPSDRAYFNFEAATICKLFRKQFAPSATFTKLSGDIDLNDDRGLEISTSVFFAQMLGLDLSSKEITYSAGAQYIVPTSYIKSKNFEWWTEFYTLIKDWKSINPGDEIAAYCERVWLSIWNHQPNPNQKLPVPSEDLY
jgi:hypothetical protein